MGRGKNWKTYRRFHELLDELCIEEGHHDNMALASELSAVSGKRSGEAFESAMKNLRNWRSGTHLPQRRNFIFLSKALHVNSDEGLKECWENLYAKARSQAGQGAARDDLEPSRRTSPAVTIFITFIVLTVGAGSLFKTSFEVAAQRGRSADVEYRKSVTLNVGDFVVVHGARGNCDEDPPNWENVVANLPELETGYWSDGDIGTRYSRNCGGPTLARGIVFNATKSGRSEISLFGDPVRIEVK